VINVVYMVEWKETKIVFDFLHCCGFESFFLRKKYRISHISPNDTHQCCVLELLDIFADLFYKETVELALIYKNGVL
jgi:hypothetical protein